MLDFGFRGPDNPVSFSQIIAEEIANSEIDELYIQQLDICQDNFDVGHFGGATETAIDDPSLLPGGSLGCAGSSNWFNSLFTYRVFNATRDQNYTVKMFTPIVGA